MWPLPRTSHKPLNHGAHWFDILLDSPKKCSTGEQPYNGRDFHARILTGSEREFRNSLFTKGD